MRKDGICKELDPFRIVLDVSLQTIRFANLDGRLSRLLKLQMTTE
jgi:hypothetical protein